MKRVIIVGSPRSNGRSAHVAEMLFEANIDERPEDELFLVPVSEIEVGPCIGCGACRKLTEVVVVDDAGGERVEMRPRCIFDDDMQTLYDLLDEADELTVVSPVYFSGPPSVMKCVLERMQPYFYAGTRKAPKRPATLHVIGEGGDPHGYDALVSEMRSALSCAGFGLERVLDWVGKVDENGEIVAEATPYGLKTLGTFGSVLVPEGEEVPDPEAEKVPFAQQAPAVEPDDALRNQQGAASPGAKGSRPKLNLSEGSRRRQSDDRRNGKPVDRNPRDNGQQGRRPSGKPKGNAGGSGSGNRRGKGGAGGKRPAGKAGDRG